MSRPGEIENFTKDKSALYKKRLLGWFFSLMWLSLLMDWNDVLPRNAECTCLASL